MELLLIIGALLLVRALHRAALLARDLQRQVEKIEVARAEIADVQSQLAGIHWMLRHHCDDGDGGEAVMPRPMAPADGA